MNWTKAERSWFQFLILISLFTIILLLQQSCNHGVQSPGKFEIYTEAIDPHPDSTANWEAVLPGLNASVGSIDLRYLKSFIPELTINKDWQGTAWRGEKISAQLVLWSKDPVAQIECNFSDFVSEDGKSLSSDVARARFVRYVLTDEFAEGCSNRTPEAYPVFLYPDALDNVSSFDIEGETARPVWITIQVPAEAVPGVYTSSMQLTAQGQESQHFRFQLEVLPQLLPPSSEWNFHLDLWQHPWSIARIYQVEPWSPEHWEIIRPYAKMLADAGQKVITTSVIEKPWGTQTEYGFESMIQWTKKADGSWVFDYTIFDNYVQFMIDMGVNRQISCYSLIPWTNELVYYNETAAQNDTVFIEPGSSAFVELWTPFLKAFRIHLEEKGWHKITNFAMDERDGESMQKMLNMMDELAPDFGIALADSRNAFDILPYLKERDS